MRACGFVAALTAALYLAWGCSGSGGDLFGGSSGSPSGDDDGSGGATASSAGTGGAVASSVGNGGGSVGSSSSASSGGGVGTPCEWQGEPCGRGMFCDAPGCNAGTCQKVLPFDQEQAAVTPVCGCDHANYWNASVAQSHGMSVLSEGECEGAGCSDGQPCPANTYCSKRLQGAASCSFSNSEGRCWGVLADCGDTDIEVRNCGNHQCSNVCEMVKAETPWYESFGCD